MFLVQRIARFLFLLLVVGRAAPTQSAVPNEFATNLRRRLVSGGTPTGGGKYPFLAVIRWQHDDDLLAPPDCHGVMVARDVVLTIWECLPNVKRGTENVVVGDFSSLDNESIQARNMMSEAIGDPTQAVVLFTVEPVTHPGFFPVKINADANTPRYRQSLDVVGYGSNRMWNESLEDKKYPREAYVKRVQASRDELCPFSSSREFCAADFGRGGPCEGDLGAPILDSAMALVGLTTAWTCGNPNYGSTFKRLPNLLEWIQATTCQLSTDEELDFCSDLVCPIPSNIYGYPFVELPAVDFRVYNKFEPLSVTQNPPQGSILWRNSTTSVTITATDKLLRNLTCTWDVRVPPLTSLGTVSFNISAGPGSVNQTSFFEERNNIRSGLVFKMSGKTQDALQGGGSISARLKNGARKSSKYVETQALELASGEGNGTKSSLRLKSEVPITFTYKEKSDVSLHVSAVDNVAPTVVTFDVKGQVTSNFRRF